MVAFFAKHYSVSVLEMTRGLLKEIKASPRPDHSHNEGNVHEVHAAPL